MAKKFDYHGAKQAGYNDEEINQYLTEKNPTFDFQGAKEAGYSPEEINEHLSTYKPQRSIASKAGRTALQFGIGAAEQALFAHELAGTAPYTPESRTLEHRQYLFDEIADLGTKKRKGTITPEEEKQLQQMIEETKSPEKTLEKMQESQKGIKTGISGGVENITGIDTEPEGFIEKAARWTGFIKNFKALKELPKVGLTLKDTMKAIAPTGTEALRGLGAGIALDMAEEGDFGPLGTMGAAVVGDLIGGGVASIPKAVANSPKNLAKAIARTSTKFKTAEKLATQKQLIQDFRKAGLQADLGTIVDSNLIKMAQARLSQSGLTGKALEEARTALSENIVKQYENMANKIGEDVFMSKHEAGEALKSTLERTKETDIGVARELYNAAREAASHPNAVIEARGLAEAVNRLESKLEPGSIKSSEQKAVLNYLKDLKNDLFDSAGNMKLSRVEDLINNKVALNNIIDYEVQGGQKQLLKDIVKELDKAILSYGKEDPRFAANFKAANEKFSEHAKTFRNKRINQILFSQDPSSILNKMNSVQGIKDVSAALSKSPEGRELLKELKRFKLEELIGKNMKDSLTGQLKFGKFVNILDKKNNSEMVKELLGPTSFGRLQRLQKATGELVESSNKYYNASKSGVTAGDIAVGAKVLYDFGNLFSGNPWPLLKTVGTVTATRQIAKLMSNPEFLKLVEDSVLASKKNDIPRLMGIYRQIEEIYKKLESPVKSAINEEI